MQLRYYQQDAYSAAIGSIKRKKHPVLQLATGTGKSLIIAAVAQHYRERDQRVWVLTHVQELVKQNNETYYRYARQQAGIVCSGLNRADFDAPVIFATIQSIINPALHGELPAPDLIIIDEAHRVPHQTGELGMYGRIFTRYPSAARLAMTATPWRTDNGLIYGDDPERFWFNHLAYTYTVPQAVSDGYLAPLVGVETELQLELEDVTVNDDFSMDEVNDLQDAQWLEGVAQSLLVFAKNRKHAAVYSPNVNGAMRAAAAIGRVTGRPVAILTGMMQKRDREDTLRRFKSGEIHFLCSVDTITTGFDFPALDCIVCLRPTVSSNLWVQIMGRGTRLHESKQNCLLLDFVGNLQRLGGVDMLETYVREKNGVAGDPLLATPAERKPKRRVLPGVRAMVPLDPMTGEQANDGASLTVEVHAVSAVPIKTRRDPNKPVLMIQYACTTVEGARIDATLFVNTEEPRPSDYAFFKNRKLAVNLPALAGTLQWQVRGARTPQYVTARKSGRYWNVTAEHFQQPQE